jgi:hypothetical protein
VAEQSGELLSAGSKQLPDHRKENQDEQRGDGHYYFLSSMKRLEKSPERYRPAYWE